MASRRRTVYGIVKRQHTLSILIVLLAAAIFRVSAESDAGTSINYRNTKYGFCFSLPASWKGYSILSDQEDLHVPGSQKPHHFTAVRIRHPKWTEQNPYEDIPILVFTHADWKLVREEKVTVSAAPIPPIELGRNARYVFALPPRFDYDFSTGYQEVESLIRQKSLHAPCGANAAAQ